MSVKESHEILINEESDKLIEQDKIIKAAKVLLGTDLSAEEVAKKAIEVASEICVFTNNNIKIEKI